MDRNPNGGIGGNIWTLWSLFVVFHGLDNYPVLLRMPKALGSIGRGMERVLTHAVLMVAAVLGWFVGLRKEYLEYTP